MQNLYTQYLHNIARFLFLSGIRVLFLLVAISKIGYGQQINSQVVDSFGASISVEGLTFDTTIGELATTTITGNGYAITQGFLQPIDLKIPCGDVVLKAFPNPVTVGMKIYAEGCDIEVASIKTYDLFGKLVYVGKPVNNQINFSSIGVGVYLVRAYNQSNQVVGVVKIIKSTI